MRRGVFVLLGSALLVLAFAGPAAAHSETGILTVESLPAEDPSAVTVRARLVYDNDLHPVPGAAVSVTGTGPDGATLPDTPLGDVGDGEYEAVVTFPTPGAWNLTVTAVGPAATATLPVEVSETSATTNPDATSVPTTTEVPENTEEGDDPGVLFFPIILGAIVVAGVTAALVVLRRR